MPKRLLFISAFLFVLITKAQQPGQYSFIRYSNSSGMLSNQINTVVQDEDGYIWIGSTDGLQRFDGIRYKSFRHKKNDSSSIASNLIWQLLIDAKKNLWILTADGKAGIFNTRNFTFHEMAIRPVKEQSLLTSTKRLVTDELGNVFLLLAGNEVLTWNEKRNELSASANFFQLKPEWAIVDFKPQPGTHKYWISIKDGGIAIYNHSTKQISYAGHNVAKEAALEKLNGITASSNFLFDRKGRLWFDSWGFGVPYVYCFDLKTKELVLNRYHFLNDIKSYYEIHEFVELKDGSIWARGLQLFAKFLEQEKKFELVYNGYLNERSIAYEAIRTIYEDREKNIWVATSNNGLYRFNSAAKNFTNITHLQRISGKPGNGSVMSFTATKWGTVLAGTWGDGLYHYDKNLNSIPIGIKGINEKMTPPIWNMFLSKDSNTIWMGAQPGLYAIDQNKRMAVYHNPPALENRTVRQIAEDGYGNLWMGMQSVGLYKWDAAKGKTRFDDGIKKINAVPNIMVNKITIDSKGYVWVALSSDGAYVIDPSTEQMIMHFGKNETGEKKLPDDDGVSSILEFDDSTIVITTASKVLLYNRVKKKTTVLTNAETMSGYIAAVEKDRNGNLWITTSSGLYRVNIHQKIFARFNREDGIDNENFVVAASGKLPNGRLLFGSSNQFLVFDPLSTAGNTSFPKVVVTDFQVKNRSLLVDSLLQLPQINLRHDQNSLNIEFSTLSYSTPYIIRYKLESLDKEWKAADKDNHAVYSYLPSGNYTLLLQLVNKEGIPADEITRLQINVSPPFYNTWWFYSALALLGAALLFWFDRERMNRKETMQKMRTDIADNLHGEINTALNNINILSEMAKLKADKDPQKSKEYIEQIHCRSYDMIIAMDDMLWSIDPGNDTMKKTVERMREYIDALKNRHGAEIDMLVDKNAELLEVNMKLRHEAFLLFKEGIKSLVEAGADKCRIHLGLEKSTLQFTIQFYNEPCNIQQLNNLLQRQDIEKKISSIHARLSVQVHKSNSVILLQIPVS